MRGLSDGGIPQDSRRPQVVRIAPRQLAADLKEPGRASTPPRLHRSARSAPLEVLAEGDAPKVGPFAPGGVVMPAPPPSKRCLRATLARQARLRRAESYSRTSKPARNEPNAASVVLRRRALRPNHQTAHERKKGRPTADPSPNYLSYWGVRNRPCRPFLPYHPYHPYHPCHHHPAWRPSSSPESRRPAPRW